MTTMKYSRYVLSIKNDLGRYNAQFFPGHSFFRKVRISTLNYQVRPGWPAPLVYIIRRGNRRELVLERTNRLPKYNQPI